MKRKKRDKRKRHRRSLKAVWILLSLTVAVLLCAFAFLFTAKGRAIGRRIPFVFNIQRALFEGAKLPYATAYGIDVSHYQGHIEWSKVGTIPFNILTRRQKAGEKMGAATITFAYSKATEGCNHIDPSIERNRTGIRSTHMLYGAYHVLTTADAAEQIKNFMRHAGLRTGDLAPMVDIEESVVGKEISKARLELKKMLRMLEHHYGTKPIIYCSHSLREEMLKGTLFKGYPLWIARYQTDEMPPQADIWQFSEDGFIPGIQAPVDLNALFDNSYSIEDYIIHRKMK